MVDGKRCLLNEGEKISHVEVKKDRVGNDEEGLEDKRVEREMVADEELMRLKEGQNRWSKERKLGELRLLRRDQLWDKNKVCCQSWSWLQ